MINVNPWLVRRKPNPSASVRLFCLPYAGGSAAIFRTWGERLPASVEAIPVQLPGRGARMAEAPLTEMHELVRALAHALRPHLDLPFAFFGHSMGAMLSLELARLLRKQTGVEPAHLFVSGCRALQLPDPHRATYDLPEPEFLEEVRRLNGTPAEVFEHPELLSFVLPLLRADFKVCQTYRYTEDLPLRCPITVFGGTEDKTTRTQLEAWAEQTRSTCTVRTFPGDHFFLHKVEPQMIEIISSQLAAVPPRRHQERSAESHPTAFATSP